MNSSKNCYTDNNQDQSSQQIFSNLNRANRNNNNDTVSNFESVHNPYGYEEDSSQEGDKECQTPPLIEAFEPVFEYFVDSEGPKSMHLSCGRDMIDLGSQILEKNIKKAIPNLHLNDWNESFQKLIENFSTDSERELSRTKKLQKTCHDFAEKAKIIGKVIISELFLEKKTIKTITEQVGGIAGGAKYFQEGIFFKLPIDSHGIYGGNEVKPHHLFLVPEAISFATCFYLYREFSNRLDMSFVI